MKTITVCKDCPDRHRACWGECEKYQAARAELERVKAERAEARKRREALQAVQYTSYELAKKRRNK